MKRTLIRLLALCTAFAAGCVSFPPPQPLSPAETAAALESRSLADEGLRSYAAVTLKRAVDTWPPREWDVDLLTVAGFYFQPSLDVARAEGRLARAAQVTAGQRPNPSLAASIEHKADSNEISPWVSLFGLDFPFEWPTKRTARIARARSEAEAARLTLATAAWDVRSRIRSATIDLVAAARRHELLARQAATQADIVEIFTKRLELGEVSQTELTRARIAAREAELLVADARRDAAFARASLAAAIGVPEAALAAVSVAAAPVIDDAAPLNAGSRQAAVAGRPDVLVALHHYAAAQSDLQLAVASRYPDIHLGPGFGWDQGRQSWAIGVSAEIPLLNRHRGEIAEAEARRDAAAARLAGVQAHVIEQFDRAAVQLTAARQKVREISEMAVSVRRQLDAAKRQFEAGEIDRLALRSAELEAESTAIAQADADRDLQRAAGEIEDAMQRPLDDSFLLPSSLDGAPAAPENRR
jgi:cobalt-zinc-cadmium efflux system outer membrane protein